jgi:hypothetical protein
MPQTVNQSTQCLNNGPGLGSRTALIVTVPLSVFATISVLTTIAVAQAAPERQTDAPRSVYRGRVDVTTSGPYSRSNSQYRGDITPDGDYVGRTSVSVDYPGGSSNTDVQVVIPRETRERLREAWANRWRNRWTGRSRWEWRDDR